MTLDKLKTGESAEYIIGRMGLPYRERGMNIISVAVDAPQSRYRVR